MAVLEFDIHDEDDPNGTPLGTITDEDAVNLWFEVHWRKAGVGGIVIHRDDAKAALIAADRYVKCRVPVISEDPLFGWWMRKGRVIQAHERGRGAELLTMSGPGSRDVLRLMRLLEFTYAPVPPASAERGSSTDPYLWRWLAQHRGAIAARVMEEGINQVLGDLLAPLHGVTFDWDRTNDSNGVAWGDAITQIEERIGTDGDTFMSTLEEGGNFTVFADPNLLFHAYQSYPSRDLTDTVTFQAEIGGEEDADPNVEATMERDLDSMERWNAMLVESLVDYGDDEVVDAGYWEVPSSASGHRAHIGYMSSPVDDTAFMESLAFKAMDNSEAGIRRMAVKVDPATHLPGPEGSNGAYWLYDTVHVQSRDGSGAWDADQDKRVSAIRFEVGVASSASTDARATRSLKTTALLDDDESWVQESGDV